MLKAKMKVIVVLSLLNVALCLKLINPCISNCTAEHISKQKRNTITIRYSIQDEECEDFDDKYPMSGGSSLSKPHIYVEKNYTELHNYNTLASNYSTLAANLSLRLNDKDACDTRGFGIIANITSLYEDKNTSWRKYICFQKGFSYRESAGTTFKKVRFPLNFTDINPGDFVTITAFSIPYHRGHSTKITRQRPRKCKVGLMGWEADCIQQLQFPTCSQLKNSSNHYCKLERNVEILMMKKSGCSYERLKITTLFPSELATTIQLHILDENKKLIDLQNVTYSNETQTISLSNYHRLNQTYYIAVNISNQLLESSEWSFIVKSCQHSNTNLLVAIISIGVGCIAVAIIIWIIRKRRISSPHFLFTKQNKQSVRLTSNENEIAIYLGYADSRHVFEQVIFSFANNLRQNLGIEVHFSPWSIEAQVQISSWMEKILNDCDKFIIVWSLQSIKIFSNPNEFDSTAVEGDIFHGLTNQLKQNLLRNFIDKSKIVSVYFDKKCADAIPEWFRKLVDKHFYLMDQFEELYAYLKDHKKYNPHSKLVTNFRETGFSLKEKIENLRNYNNGCKINKISSQDSSNNLINDLNIDLSLEDGYDINNLNDVIPPQCTCLLPDNLHVISPSSGEIAQDLNVSPPSVLESSPQVLITPPDSLITPPESLVTVIPPDSLVTPPDSLVTPPDSLVTPPDSLVTPPDFDVTPPDSLVTPPDFDVTPPDSLVTPLQSSVAPPDFNVEPPNCHVFRQDLHLVQPLLNV